MIKNIIILISISMVSLFGVSGNLSSSYSKGLANAKRYNKTLMVMFTSENCKQCSYMQSSIYEDKEISNYIDKHFIYLELDKDIESYGHKVVISPTIYFINSKGKTKGKIVGARDRGAFLKELKRYR
jgi:thioredoxin-related protein